MIAATSLGWRWWAGALVALAMACGRTGLAGDDGGWDLSQSAGAAPLCAGADEALRERWNLAVQAAAPLPRDFRWLSVTDFPLPTYRQGDAVAYDAFADVLLRFWDVPGNVEFVRSCGLFDRAYPSGPPLAQQAYVQLRPVTTVTLVSSQRRAALAQACRQIGCP